MAKSDANWLLWFRSQTFWNEDRELAVWEWLSYNHESSVAAREYEKACQELLKLPARSDET